MNYHSCIRHWYVCLHRIPHASTAKNRPWISASQARLLGRTCSFTCHASLQLSRLQHFCSNFSADDGSRRRKHTCCLYIFVLNGSKQRPSCLAVVAVILPLHGPFGLLTKWQQKQALFIEHLSSSVHVKSLVGSVSKYWSGYSPLSI